jgi:hypothetical protein
VVFFSVVISGEMCIELPPIPDLDEEGNVP